MSTRREDAAPMLDDLRRQREHAERTIARNKGLGEKFLKGPKAELADIERQENDLYRWIAEEENAR